MFDNLSDEDPSDPNKILPSSWSSWTTWQRTKGGSAVQDSSSQPWCGPLEGRSYIIQLVGWLWLTPQGKCDHPPQTGTSNDNTVKLDKVLAHKDQSNIEMYPGMINTVKAGWWCWQELAWDEEDVPLMVELLWTDFFILSRSFSQLTCRSLQSSSNYV